MVVAADIAIVVVGIPTVIVVDIAVAIVVDAVVGYFVGVYPAVQVFMSPIAASVNDGHHDGISRGGNTACGKIIPGLRQAHDGWSPLLTIVGVIRNRFTQLDIGVVVLDDTHIRALP